MSSLGTDRQEYLVFGAGWDPVRNRTFELLFGGGAPDLDLLCVAFNRFGEVMDVLSPKGKRALPGVGMGHDARTGSDKGDDERLAALLGAAEDVQDVQFEELGESKYLRPLRMRYKQAGREKAWDLMRSHRSVAILIFRTDIKK